jgi:hypothetical protein
MRQDILQVGYWGWGQDEKSSFTRVIQLISSTGPSVLPPSSHKSSGTSELNMEGVARLFFIHSALLSKGLEDEEQHQLWSSGS